MCTDTDTAGEVHKVHEDRIFYYKFSDKIYIELKFVPIFLDGLRLKVSAQYGLNVYMLK